MTVLIIAKTNSAIKLISKLAHIIWQEHYTTIIGSEQVEYMLNKFQTVETIKNQIEQNSEYYIISYNNNSVGYICIKKEEDTLFLSKIYVLNNYRRKGVGKTAMQFIEDRAKHLNCNSISLTVNRHNTNSISAYHKIGFKTIQELIIDIGNGFVMDDFKLRKVF
jgi:ribosomal protein S18 acetylase RimI-like enzyme